MIPFHLQKWYFDLITADGYVLYLYFIAYRIAGLSQGYVSALLTAADEWRIESSLHIKPVFEAGKFIFGDSVLTSGRDGACLRLRLPQLALDLCYRATVPAWQPNEGGILLERRRKQLSWRVPYAKAEVSGWAQAEGAPRIELCGFGYHDFVEMTIPPWRLPVAELLWGRAHCGTYALVYNQIKTRDGECLQQTMLRDEAQRTMSAVDHAPVSMLLELDGRGFQIYEREKGAETELSHDQFTLRLNRRRILVQGSLTEGDRIRPGLFKQFLIHTAGEAHELKMMSDATLFIGEETIKGQAIHERVEWR
jgi:hypothetical protein